MSAAIYLAFAAGIVILALLGAVLSEFVNPIFDVASTHATSAEAQTGLEWAEAAWDIMPLMVLGLLVLALLVGIVNRRSQVGGGGGGVR